MPIVEAGDIVIASMVKYQTYGGAPNLLSERRTDVHVYEAQRIPTCRSLGSAWGALKKPTRKVNREPTAKENEYVLWLYEKIDKSTIPDQQEFSARAEQSRNIRDKFKLLKDVRDQNFADVIVQIVREPFDLGDKICVWVSDYTENAGFFHKTRNDAASADGYSYRDGDPYGYTNKFNKKQASSTDDANSAWIGPYGKTSVQLTCWEPHATFLRHNVRAGDWVRVRNVQVGYGRNSVNIEGFVREDRSFPNRVCVELLDVHADRETIDQRLLDALRRKRDYERSEKASEQTSQKRKAEEAPKKENAKSKRQKKRESKQKAAEEEKAKEEATHNLNDLSMHHTCQDHSPTSQSTAQLTQANSKMRKPGQAARTPLHPPRTSPLPHHHRPGPSDSRAPLHLRQVPHPGPRRRFPPSQPQGIRRPPPRRRVRRPLRRRGQRLLIRLVSLLLRRRPTAHPSARMGVALRAQARGAPPDRHDEEVRPRRSLGPRRQHGRAAPDGPRRG